MLGQCPSLDTLNLESNGIGAEGAGMYMGSWRGCYCMGLITFQAGSRTKSHHIASGGERGGRAGAVLFIRRAIPQRQMGVNNIRERGFAMLRTSIRDGKPSQDHPRKINTRSLSPVPKEAEGGRDLRRQTGCDSPSKMHTRSLALSRSASRAIRPQ